MTNKEWLATLNADDWWEKVDWLFHDYGMRWDNTRLAIIDWLEEEHNENFD